MRQSGITLIILLTISVFSPGCVDNQHSSLTLGLFHGMEKDSAGTYFDKNLDTIIGLTHSEYQTIWYAPADSIRFQMTMGLYIDEKFPSRVVRNTLFKKLNSIIPDCVFDKDYNQEALLKKGVNPALSTDSFIHGWDKLLDRVNSMNGYNSDFSNFPMVIATRGCAVCHKIYEDSIYATYVVGMSYDNHSSCGCPSYADYYTINKATGKILSSEDVLEQFSQPDRNDMVRKAYEKAAKAIGFAPTDITGDQLLKRATGMAILYDEILIYYHPYTIGSGTEGQYNLFIPTRQ